MELSFICENSADASFLAQELELALRRDGVPEKALSLRQSSSENMDVGSVLWIGFEAAAQVLGPVASITSFAKCVYDLTKKYNSGIVVETDDTREEIPAPKINLKRIETALNKSHRSKSKSKLKSRA